MHKLSNSPLGNSPRVWSGHLMDNSIPLLVQDTLLEFNIQFSGVYPTLSWYLQWKLEV